MSPEESASPENAPVARGQFATTHWSVVLSAAEASRNPVAFEALSHLCQAYWFPLYAYVRRRGHDAGTAADLTQAFFEELLERNYVGQADPTRGRFRSFLLKALEHFLAKEWQKSRRLKRGGGRTFVSFDALEADALWQLEGGDALSAGRLFDRRWALTVLERALERLRAEYAESGRQELFAALEGFLSAEGSIEPLARAGERLGMTEGAVKVAVHRLRQRYGQALRTLIAETVARPGDVEQELRELMNALST